MRAENITPSILRWARETSGLSVEDAAARLGLKTSARGGTASEKLEAFERGDAKPTRIQLLKIAAIYRRPLTTFYRKTPPIIGDRGEDFRTLPGAVSDREAALLDALLRDIRARQDMVKSILEDDEDIHLLTFVGSMPVTLNIVEAAKVIRQAIGIENEHALRRELRSSDALFSVLREKVENIGVFVLLVGDLGSHHTTISEHVFRGFAIADEIAPFIIINDQDAIPARSFTLIHELTHIFTGSTGVSNAPSTIVSNAQPARIERFCNDVASEFLLPRKLLQEFDRLEHIDLAGNMISDVATKNNVSEAMVAYRFWRTGLIDTGIYQELAVAFAQRWQYAKKARRERARGENKKGPSYYTLRKHRLGNALVNLVDQTLRANELTYTKAAKILSVKPSNVESLLGGVKTLSGSLSSKKG